jgi:hypothetical protein
MPPMLLRVSSSFSVMSLSTSAGAAPGSLVMTETIGKSTLGKRSTPSWK